MKITRLELFVLIAAVCVLLVAMHGRHWRDRDGYNHISTTYTIIPPITLTAQTIDAELGSEFCTTLTSNVNYGIVNMRDGRMLNLTVTNAKHAITFINPIHWLPTNTIPYAASNSVTLFNFMQNSNTIYGQVMRQNYLLVTNTGDFHLDVSREPTNW